MPRFTLGLSRSWWGPYILLPLTLISPLVSSCCIVLACLPSPSSSAQPIQVNLRPFLALNPNFAANPPTRSPRFVSFQLRNPLLHVHILFLGSSSSFLVDNVIMERVACLQTLFSQQNGAIKVVSVRGGTQARCHCRLRSSPSQRRR